MAKISQAKINKKFEEKIYFLFKQLISDLKNPQEVEIFLRDFLTKTELKVLLKRFAVIYLLNQKESYQQIKKNLGVSSTTIASLTRQFKKPGIKLALKKIEAEEWATQWLQKLEKVVKFHRK